MQLSLKAARTNENLSQQALAKYLGVSSSTLSRWELGEIMIPEEKLIKLCAICHIKKEDIKITLKGSKKENGK